MAFGGQKLSATVSNVYVKFVQAAPDAFGRLYRFAKAISTPRIKSPVYLFNAAYARKMEQLLTDYAPDLIVCTHMFGGQSVTYLRRHDLWNGLFAMVMTDYTIHPFIEGHRVRRDVHLQGGDALRQAAGAAQKCL